MQAADFYYASAFAGLNNGTSCANAYAYNDGTNGISTAGKWSAGNVLHVCGTWTGSANQSPFITAAGNGSSGNVITIKFESGSILQAPYFSSAIGGSNNGAIALGSHANITIDGANTGTIQNTANGASLANQQSSSFISGFAGSNITVQNLTLANLYVQVSGSAAASDSSLYVAIDFSGSNWLITGNTIHDCGWCIYDVYANGDTHFELSNNNIYNMGHGVAYATVSLNTCTAPCLLYHDNHVHDAAIWNANSPTCTYHDSALHVFGGGPTTANVINEIDVYNNLFDGDWGICATGVIFIEGAGSSNASHVVTYNEWNNVFDLSATTSFADSQGWVGLFSGSGSVSVYNDTFVYLNATDNVSACYSIQSVTNLTFENNTISPCPSPLSVSSLSGTSVIDYNAYGPSCQDSGNCFAWSGTYQGSFSAWKTTCAMTITNCELHSFQNNSMLLNAGGSPQSGSPVIKWGVNLGSVSSGRLSTLANDTTKGNSRNALARPAAGTCSSQGNLPCWDIGAYQFQAAGATADAIISGGVVSGGVR